MAAGVGSIIPAPPFAQHEGDQLVQQIRAAAAEANVSVQSLRGGISVLIGSGGNIAVLSGRDGKLIVDAGIPGRLGQIEKPSPVSARNHRATWSTPIGTSTIRTAINFSRPPARPSSDTTTRESTCLKSRGAGLELHLSCGAGRRAADHRVCLRRHASDQWHRQWSSSTIGLLTTIVIPGHGPVGDRSGLIEFRDMLVATRDRVHSLKKQGRSVDDVVAAKPTSIYDAKWASLVPASLFTRLVYAGV